MKEDGEEDKKEAEEENDEGRLTGSAKLVEIVFDNIVELFGQRVKVLRECKRIAFASEMLD